MIPIRDDNPAGSTAVVTGLIAAATAFVFFAIQPRQPERSVEFLYAQASIPCEIVTGDPLTIEEINQHRCDANSGGAVFPGKSVLVSILASLFFHGGLLHLLGNLWVLWIFGNNVEDVMGKGQYLVFYLVAGVIATLSHVILNAGSTIPVVGASGAIAAVMGAYLIVFPTHRVLSVIPPLFFIPFHVPAMIFLGIWFLGQFALAGADTNVAWEAHVGGFVVGMMAGVWLRARRRGVLAARP